MDWLKGEWARRPWWMNLMMIFCLYMTFFYVPWDLFVKPAATDEEVWFAIRFHGLWAKILAVPHWVVYAFGALGFWRMRSWMHPWAALYLAQVTFSFAVFPWIYGADAGVGFQIGSSLVVGGLWAWLMVAIVDSKSSISERIIIK